MSSKHSRNSGKAPVPAVLRSKLLPANKFWLLRVPKRHEERTLLLPSASCIGFFARTGVSVVTLPYCFGCSGALRVSCSGAGCGTGSMKLAGSAAPTGTLLACGAGATC